MKWCAPKQQTASTLLVCNVWCDTCMSWADRQLNQLTVSSCHFWQSSARNKESNCYFNVIELNGLHHFSDNRESPQHDDTLLFSIGVVHKWRHAPRGVKGTVTSHTSHLRQGLARESIRDKSTCRCACCVGLCGRGTAATVNSASNQYPIRRCSGWS